MEGMLHLPQPPTVSPVRPAAPTVALAKAVPKAAPKPPPKKGPPPTVWQLLQHHGSVPALRVGARHEAAWVKRAQRLLLV